MNRAGRTRAEPVESSIPLGAHLLALGFALAAPVAAQLYVPGAGIHRTPHDIAQSPLGGVYPAMPNDAFDRICIYCHAPHNTFKLSPAAGGPAVNVGGGPKAPDAFDYLPLWSHELTALYLSYTMYQNGPGAPITGPKASQALDGGMVPGSVSLLCLSCHDGSVAVNRYGNVWQPAASQSSGGSEIFDSYIIGRGAYLGNHHPIGFNYYVVQAVDPEIRPAGRATLGAAGLVEDHLYGNGTLECGSCHSVHNKGNTGEVLLWRSAERSRLCLTCHDKGDDPGTTVP